jgi:hypothetical protein
MTVIALEKQLFSKSAIFCLDEVANFNLIKNQRTNYSQYQWAKANSLLALYKKIRRQRLIDNRVCLACFYLLFNPKYK